LPSVIREAHVGGWCIRLDLDRQVLRLEASDVEGPPALLPVLPCPKGGAVSAAALLFKAKQFDDGLLAAAELATQRGAGRFPGKAALLRTLAEALIAGPADEAPAAALVLAACELGGHCPPAPPLLRGLSQVVVEDFLRDEFRSKPLGFYSLSAELEALFRQDRLLQGPLEPGLASGLARALGRDPGGWAGYDACINLAARLTGPPALPGLHGPGEPRAFFPPSRSHEVELFESLYGDRPIPEGFDLMGELIRRVRSGEIDLRPSENSGWYDRLAWSLEPLIAPERTPEGARLDLGSRYRLHLEALFRGGLALAREAHVKQLKGGYGGGRAGPREPPVYVSPELTVEPFPTLYARRAEGCRFVRSVLEGSFGADALQGLRRPFAGGKGEASLAEELGWMERLFEGAAAMARRELGLSPAPGAGHAEVVAAWRTGLPGDPDVGGDARMMVPVFRDVGRKKTKVWALLGWRLLEVVVAYKAPPSVLEVVPEGGARPAAGGRPPPVEFSSATYRLATPEVAEVYVEQLLDREEFRRHCDRHRTRAAILANLR
jgi:hypothetical protein